MIFELQKWPINSSKAAFALIWTLISRKREKKNDFQEGKKKQFYDEAKIYGVEDIDKMLSHFATLQKRHCDKIAITVHLLSKNKILI